MDAVVAATPVAGLLGQAFFQRAPGLKAVVDLGMPRNVVPEAVGGAALLDLEYLERLGEERRSGLQAGLARAEQVGLEEVELLVAELVERFIAPVITRMWVSERQTLEELVGELVEPELIERLAHRFAHFPVKGLRGLARQYGSEAAQTFLQEAGLMEVGRG